MDEYFAKIEGFNGKYLIGTKGTILSFRKNTYKEMFTTKVNGYHVALLSSNKKVKRILIHRLVAETFIPNPLGLPCVNHINTLRDDNRVENLEWCTHKENMNKTRKVLTKFIPS